MKLAKDHTTNFCGSTITIPAGTPIVKTKDGSGAPLYAVASEALVAKLSGNSHDAKYRYCFVPAELVAKD